MWRLAFFIIFFPTVSMAVDLGAQLLPLPNTEYTTKCSDGMVTIKTGPLTSKSGEFKMNVHRKFKRGTQILTMEPWNRFVMIFSATQAGDFSSQAKVVSGNLNKAALIVGSSYNGQIEEVMTKKGKSTTVNWQINVKIEGVKQVSFNKETQTAYIVKLIKTQIGGLKTLVSVDFVYLVKAQQFLTVKIAAPNLKKPHECTLVEYKSTLPTTPPAAPAPSTPAPSAPVPTKPADKKST